jgi:hypothetical protein
MGRRARFLLGMVPAVVVLLVGAVRAAGASVPVAALVDSAPPGAKEASSFSPDPPLAALIAQVDAYRASRAIDNGGIATSLKGKLAGGART